MAQTYAVRASIREGGVTYRSPAEAFVGADEIEHDAERRADQYRRDGNEGMADTTIDRGREKAERLRTWARQREEFEARETAQPPNRPTEPPRKKTPSPPSKGASRPPRRRARARARSGRSSPLFGGRTGSTLSRGYTRSGGRAQVTAATGLGWQIAGATVLVALLTLFLTRRGATAFADLTGFAATALKIVVDPVDPLRPHLLDDYIAQAQAANLPAVPLPKAAAAHTGTTQLASRRPPTNRRSSTRGLV